MTNLVDFFLKQRMGLFNRVRFFSQRTAPSFSEMATKADKNLFRSIINQKCHCHVQWSLLSLVLTNKRNSSTDWLCKLLAIGCMLYYLFNYLECRYSGTPDSIHNLSTCHFLHLDTGSCLLKHLAFRRPSWNILYHQKLNKITFAVNLSVDFFYISIRLLLLSMLLSHLICASD